jgi:hypothetical protein
MLNNVMTPFAMDIILRGIRTQLLLVPSPRLHLFQNNITPTPLSLLTDFTEATYDGYANQTQPYAGGPFRETDGSFSIRTLANFAMTGSTTPNIIYGYYVTDNPNTGLLFAGKFDTPIAMVDAFSYITYDNKLTLPVNGLAGGMIPVV